MRITYTVLLAIGLILQARKASSMILADTGWRLAVFVRVRVIGLITYQKKISRNKYYILIYIPF